MNVQANREPAIFRPIEVNITITSEEELENWEALFGFDISGPNAMKHGGIINDDVAKYATQLFAKLYTAVEEVT